MNETAWNSLATECLIKIHYSIEYIFASFPDITEVHRKELKERLDFPRFYRETRREIEPFSKAPVI